MTGREKQRIINEVVKPGERVTGTEFVNRLCRKACEAPTNRERDKYLHVLEEWLKVQESDRQRDKEADRIFEL